jgi:hypothetical protein
LGEYEKTAGDRVIPVIALTRRAQGRRLAAPSPVRPEPVEAEGKTESKDRSPKREQSHNTAKPKHAKLK